MPVKNEKLHEAVNAIAERNPALSFTSPSFGDAAGKPNSSLPNGRATLLSDPSPVNSRS